MYNYFKKQKQRQITTEINHLKQTKHKRRDSRQAYEDHLVRRYLERATHGYQRMIQANNEINNRSDYHHQFRSFDKSKNIGPPSFYYKFRNQKDRIEEASKENQSLDQIPFYSKCNPINHKFRENKSSDNFKFTPYDTASRVLQNIQGMKTNEVPTSWTFNLRQYIKQRSKNAENKNIYKSMHEHNLKQLILPSLNIKHHPKSLQSIRNEIQVGPLKDANILNKRHHKKVEQRNTKRRSQLKNLKIMNAPLKSWLLQNMTERIKQLKQVNDQDFMKSLSIFMFSSISIYFCSNFLFKYFGQAGIMISLIWWPISAKYFFQFSSISKIYSILRLYSQIVAALSFRYFYILSSIYVSYASHFSIFSIKLFPIYNLHTSLDIYSSRYCTHNLNLFSLCQINSSIGLTMVNKDSSFTIRIVRKLETDSNFVSLESASICKSRSLCIFVKFLDCF